MNVTKDFVSCSPLVLKVSNIKFENIDKLRKLKEIDNISIAVVPYRRDFPFVELAAQKKIIH